MTKPAEKPKPGPHFAVIDAILEADRTAPGKQRHTAKRIFERLRDEHSRRGAVRPAWLHETGRHGSCAAMLQQRDKPNPDIFNTDSQSINASSRVV